MGRTHTPGCSLQPVHTPHTPPWHAHVCIPTHLGTLHAHTCTHTLVCAHPASTRVPTDASCRHVARRVPLAAVPEPFGCSVPPLALLLSPKASAQWEEGPVKGRSRGKRSLPALGRPPSAAGAVPSRPPAPGAQQSLHARREEPLAPAPHYAPVPRTLGLTHPSTHHVARSTTPGGVHTLLAAPPNPKPRRLTAMGPQRFAAGEPQHRSATPGGTPLCLGEAVLGAGGAGRLPAPAVGRPASSDKGTWPYSQFPARWRASAQPR